MFLTSDILKEYEACPEGQTWFDRLFPNGAELIDVMHTRHVPASFLHWGKLHLTTSPEEQRAYNEVLNIKDSTDVFECSDIANCHSITQTDHATNSNYIYSSHHIIDSTDVYNSSRVNNSQHIRNSSVILNSDTCVISTNVKASHNILESDFIINSHDIFRSSLITDSAFIFNSKNITNSLFISEAHELNHCLFCTGNVSKDYQIFNNSCNEVQWNFIYEEGIEFLKDLSLNLIEPWEYETPGSDATVHYSYLEMFAKFGDKLDDFIYWVKHLPYFDPLLAYKITFIPNFMQ